MANTSYCNGSTKLFDIKTDPHELRNLVEDPEFADELDRLLTEYERWSGDIVDHGLVSEQVYLESIWPDQV